MSVQSHAGVVDRDMINSTPLVEKLLCIADVEPKLVNRTDHGE